MDGFMGTQQLSSYLQLYKFLLVLSEEQIVKLRKIAVGTFRIFCFFERSNNARV